MVPTAPLGFGYRASLRERFSGSVAAMHHNVFQKVAQVGQHRRRHSLQQCQ